MKFLLSFKIKHTPCFGFSVNLATLRWLSAHAAKFLLTVECVKVCQLVVVNNSVNFFLFQLMYRYYFCHTNLEGGNINMNKF